VVTEQVHPAVAPLPAEAPPNALAATRWSNGTAVAIYIRSDFDHPAAIAGLIVHEATNARAGYHKECGDWERDAYAEQDRFFQWMDATFGRPDLNGANYLARASAGFRLRMAPTPC
jgi:hypothetical protein